MLEHTNRDVDQKLHKLNNTVRVAVIYSAVYLKTSSGPSDNRGDVAITTRSRTCHGDAVGSTQAAAPRWC